MKKLVKELLAGILAIAIFMGFILGMFTVAELLASVITMEMIMAVVYIALGFSFIYIAKEVF